MAIDFTGIATDLISQLGYGGMSVGLVLDSFGIPIPSEVLLAIGGALSATGRFNPWVVFFLGTLAQVVGGLMGYAIGRYGGNPVLERYGKYIFISKRDLKRTHDAFERYGIWMTMFGRCLPVIRGLIAYPAGIARMRVDYFIIFTAIGSAIWSAIFVYLGYVLGDNIDTVESLLQQFSVVVVIAIVLLVVWHFREHLGKLSRRKGAESGKNDNI